MKPGGAEQRSESMNSVLMSLSGLSRVNLMTSFLVFCRSDVTSLTPPLKADLSKNGQTGWSNAEVSCWIQASTQRGYVAPLSADNTEQHQ